MVIGKSTRVVWKRRFQGFWTDFSHNRIGILGVILLSLFFLTAIFAPFIAPYSQSQIIQYAPRQADEFAFPDWIGLIEPNLADLPPQKNYALNWSTVQSPAGVDLKPTDNGVEIYYNASLSGNGQPISVVLNQSFDYPYQPMRLFSVQIPWSASPDKVVTIWKTIPHLNWTVKVGETGSIAYMIQLSLTTPNGTATAIWDQNWARYSNADVHTKPNFWSSRTSTKIDFSSDLPGLAEKLGYKPEAGYDLSRKLMYQKGVYTWTMTVTLKAGALVDSAGKVTQVPLPEATGNVTIGNGVFGVFGRRWGVLGTDGEGHDVFSQLVYGSGISLTIGLTAAFVSTAVGILVGVASGYLGGGVDEVLMRSVDVLLCLPLLPMLLIFIKLLGYSVYWIVLIISLFGWQGLARVIRSQTLSIRETAYVESAVASGSSKGHVMSRHIIPNVIPATVTHFILSVPGAIILEAALSFIGMGDPFAPTWGKMLEFARTDLAYSPTNLAWWDILPPGVAICLLCMSFVFIGHAVDEIMNPRLRRRR